MGARFHSALKPLIKNFWLMTMMIMVSSICKIPIATWLPCIKPGSGQFHSMCPMEKYISTTQKISEAIRRRLRRGVSVSFKASADGAADWAAAFLGLAP